jgi:hypothetical protein
LSVCFLQLVHRGNRAVLELRGHLGFARQPLAS